MHIVRTAKQLFGSELYPTRQASGNRTYQTCQQISFGLSYLWADDELILDQLTWEECISWTSQIQLLPNSHLTSDHLKKHQNKPPYISTSFPNRTFINVFPLETSTSCVGATKIYICCSSTKTAHLRSKISLATFCIKTNFWRLKSAKIYSLMTKNAQKCRKLV